VCCAWGTRQTLDLCRVLCMGHMANPRSLPCVLAWGTWQTRVFWLHAHDKPCSQVYQYNLFAECVGNDTRQSVQKHPFFPFQPIKQKYRSHIPPYMTPYHTYMTAYHIYHTYITIYHTYITHMSHKSHNTTSSSPSKHKFITKPHVHHHKYHACKININMK
jgi:hypothetical protein